MIYRDLCAEFILDQDWSENHERWSRRMLENFGSYLVANDLDYAGITAGDFTRILKAMRADGRSWSYRNGIYTTAQNFYRWCKTRGHLETHPFIDPDMKPKRPQKKRKTIRTIDMPYIEAIMRTANAYDDTTSRRDRAIIHLMITTGMRRVEIAGLCLGDINGDAKEMLLARTKGDHERLAFLTSAAKISLDLWLAVRPKCNTERVFITLHGAKNGIYQPMRPDAINKVLARIVKRAGIPEDVKITPHMFRHTFATHCAQAGDPFALMRLMGHTNIKSTEMYIHSTKDQLRKIAKNAPDVRG